MYAGGWGRIVNVSSMHGLRASAFKSAYVAAKHGLEGLSKVAALEGAPHGVTSNCVNPGYVRTPWWRARSRARPPRTGSLRRRLSPASSWSAPRSSWLIEPAEVAAVCLWLCGPHTGYITGASLPVDGGWGAH